MDKAFTDNKAVRSGNAGGKSVEADLKKPQPVVVESGESTDDYAEEND